MSEISYASAQIYMRKGQMGLHLVNDQRQSFILYAKPLMAMVNHRGEYSRIKHRNGLLKQAIGYHPGEIWGEWEYLDSGLIRVRILLGAADLDIELDSETGCVQNVVKQYEFLFSVLYFDVLYEALVKMVKHKDEFRELLDDAETSIGL